MSLRCGSRRFWGALGARAAAPGRGVRLGPLVALSLLNVSCITTLDQEQSPVGELVHDCVVPVPDGVASLGAPLSLEYPGGSLWFWEWLELSDGGFVASPSAFVSSAEEACAEGVSLNTNQTGEPVSLLELSEEEIAANEVRDDDRQFGLSPTGGFVHDGTGYLFYEHVLVGPEFVDREVLGTGLCLIPAGATTCDRVAVDGETLLWEGNERVFNRGGVVLEDRAFLYGCRQVASFTSICTVASAPLDRLTTPSAYRLWNAFDGWVDELSDAAVVGDELGPVSVAPYRDQFIVTVLDLFESRIYVRLTADPTDEFGRRFPLFDLVRPQSDFPSGGREHAGLRRSSNTIHVSYATDHPRVPGLHLATFRFVTSFGDE